MNFSTRLQNIIKEKNIDISNLAQQLNITKNTINNWLNGKSKPHTARFVKLCLLLKVRSNYLLGLDNYKN